ncbi:MAG TPA: MazG nucleotide pyrophosphohydrolase domain-containing protein [Candidatus Hydrothermia bacterium]|nr:nucleotide pyrophosphohydrolase [Candidatus Hydrothermae bacterium]MDD3649186.1 MazG nucleotide pyrophosphohydrolase domain-containing protein [Candidatus Hydrothermia bacterium]MDD5572445.1 MazG nucleotide pyrophosphohydrolase domain-containing protein [Candidatus Hydrothermia bacterium]HOK23382.1 MazG nucleotide pyrophosphohydrolase domain-containing protein [Candidatus Hydrothermia bacterium]HOL24192.1 MazG nucleotide pyrophosphohydrolase domain-containing protein [Candidatus Hydrothermia
MEIKEFQKLIKDIYFIKDSRRGKAETFQWFVEEVGELAKALRHGKPEELSEELSDVCAWLFSLANLIEIDIESCLRKYTHGCPKCGKVPCKCKE